MRQRRWRHLDTCQYQTILAAGVPRVECEEHKVRQVGIPWEEERSRFTAICEALILDWLQNASIAEVAQMMGLSWDEVDGVMSLWVERLKYHARGFRNRHRFRDTIYFYFGGLDDYPHGIPRSPLSHTNS